MYKITWDKETGGVLLSTKVSKDTLGYSPRPVFFEELDLLGIDKLGWTYPHCQEPLMWAINKQYYYHGKLCFEAKGANIYDSVTILLRDDAKHLTLRPIDIKEMLKRNSDCMFLLENEAIEFIRDVYVAYSNVNKAYKEIKANQIDFEVLVEKLEKRTKQKMAIVKEDCDSFDIVPFDVAKTEGKRILHTTKIDKFIVSFSAGKDSQVVLDLCTRALPSTVFEVIYSDTGYELPSSLALYDEIQSYYKKRFPDLKFTIARNHESVLNYWDKIGTPSDTHRWCCTIMKTAPLYRTFKIEDNKQARVLTFEGIRAEESARRGIYLRIGKGVKHATTTNARPVFLWNTVEIFLYLFKYNLFINSAYRCGKARVGCLICPFSSSWDDMIVNRCYHKELKPFTDKIIKAAKDAGIKDINEYLKNRNWKFRASGNSIKNDTQIVFYSDDQNFQAKVIYPKQDIFIWLPILGSIVRNNADDINRKGELKYKNDVYSFDVKYEKDSFKIIVYDLVYNPTNSKLISLLKRILYKTAYCIQCEACEVECPTGALSVYPKIFINSDKCIHCFKCLEFHNKGCIVANSLSMTNGTNLKAKTGIDRYSTFGLHEEWIDEFFAGPLEYWGIQQLGTKQVSSMKSWLKEAEIVDSKLKLTELGAVLKKIYPNNPTLIWEIILINLSYNSFIVNWVLNNIKIGQPYDNMLIDETIKLQYEDVYGMKTIQNARAAFMQLMKYSPIGSTLRVGVEIDLRHRKHESYNDLCPEALAYSIYKYAEIKDVSILRVSDFYRQDEINGVYREFGIVQSELIKKLRHLNSDSNRVIIAELNMGLEHITLRDDLNAVTALEILLKQ